MSNIATDMYSSMNISCPWRGIALVPDVSVSQGDMQAVMFMYSGILATASTGGAGPAPKDHRGFLINVGKMLR
jgi:hypothetical protein